MTLLDRVLLRLEQEFAAAEKHHLFTALKSHLLAEAANETYATIAARFRMTESAVKGSAYRMRQRYREVFHEEVANTVDTHEEMEAEIRHLMAVVSR